MNRTSYFEVLRHRPDAYVRPGLVGAAVGTGLGTLAGAARGVYRQRDAENFDWGQFAKDTAGGAGVGAVSGGGLGLLSAVPHLRHIRQDQDLLDMLDVKSMTYNQALDNVSVDNLAFDGALAKRISTPDRAGPALNRHDQLRHDVIHKAMWHEGGFKETPDYFNTTRIGTRGLVGDLMTNSREVPTPDAPIGRRVPMLVAVNLPKWSKAHREEAIAQHLKHVDKHDKELAVFGLKPEAQALYPEGVKLKPDHVERYAKALSKMASPLALDPYEFSLADKIQPHEYIADRAAKLRALYDVQPDATLNALSMIYPHHMQRPYTHDELRERLGYPSLAKAAAGPWVRSKLAGVFDAAFDTFNAARAKEEARQAQRDAERFPALHATQAEMMRRSDPTFTPIGQRR